MHAPHRTIGRVALLATAATVTPAAHGVPGEGLGTGSAAPPPPAVLVDPALPTGDLRWTSARPAGAEPPACSLRRPTCVHRGPGVSDRQALAALGALEAAYERLVLALRLPAPEPDRGRGQTEGFDLYLDASLDAEDPTLRLDPLLPSGFDRASGFCVTPSAPRGGFDRAATLCLGEAIAARLAPAAPASVRRGFALHLWLASGAVTGRDLELLAATQAAPERALAGADGTASAGTALLFEHLESSRSRAGPGALATALLALAATDTPAEALEWHDEPDLFDVLRHTFGARPSQVAQWLGPFAVARAFLGDPDDRGHLPRLSSVSATGRIHLGWSLPLSTLPRRVACARPVEPSGSTYLWVDLDEALASDELGFQADWEPPVGFQWTLVRVSTDGRELSRVAVPYQERATSAVQRLHGLATARAVLIVGTNIGGIDLDHPYDPDLVPAEPSGCTVYVTPL